MYTYDDDDLPPPLVQSFIPVPRLGVGHSLKTTNKGTRDTNIAKALLDSIILLDDLREYMTSSEQQLIDTYIDLQYEVIFVFPPL